MTNFHEWYEYSKCFCDSMDAAMLLVFNGQDLNNLDVEFADNFFKHTEKGIMEMLSRKNIQMLKHTSSTLPMDKLCK